MANVRDYGAIGDGVTDDTDALQHAIDVGDGLLEFNKGTYRISRSLLLDTTRQGFGAVRGAGGTTRLEMHGPGPAIRVVGDHRGTPSHGVWPGSGEGSVGRDARLRQGVA